jgi:tetratricopeptide (TPR) repeat protein
LPTTKSFDVPVTRTPIRILLITARPEDDSCSYIDHRASALPLVEAMESLPGLVKIHVLSPPTLPALREELDRARDNEKPYHVVHFDGHGIYDRHAGLGGLCFEDPQDLAKLDRRGHQTISTKELGPLLRDHRIPLIFLEACQTATAEKASESVASELLKVGVASVVAMSHSVLVETARRFVEAFYDALARGARVGDAMLEGQRILKDDTFRANVFGVGELRLEDWFVPVLFQEKDDPQLFHTTSSAQTREDFQVGLTARLGDLPAVAATGFIGRSRELLALQRLLRHERYGVVRGQGGEGKTALAAEFARWMVRSHQVHRAAFVSVEGLERNVAEMVLDKLGDQLIKRGFSTQADCQGDLEKAEREIERALREQGPLLVLDNMESILLPPFIEKETPEALSQEARAELMALLALCARLNGKGDTRFLFTSREALPAPFDAARHRLELHQLDKEDAVKLVERVLHVEASGNDIGTILDTAREEIERLVEAVSCHARTLALLAPALRERGVEETRASLVGLMAEMEKKFPGSRERSLFASVELSLRRLSDANRNRARVLGVFHGCVDLDVLEMMMQWEKADTASLAVALVETGLATLNRFNHLTLNPALCPYLRRRMDSVERELLTASWVETMRRFTGFLMQEQGRNIEVAATLTVLELPNLFALLDLVQRAGDAEAMIDLATSLFSLLQPLGRPRLLTRVGQVRDSAAIALGDTWSHARFNAIGTRIQQQLASGQILEAFEAGEQLVQRAKAAGEQAYPGADYDLAMACILLARVLQTIGRAEQALPLLDEAHQRFETFAKAHPGEGAERMASVCITEQGDCLAKLGRLDESAAAYEERMRRAEQLGDERGVAVTKAQLGTVRLDQRRYPEALAAYAEARERFTQLNEPASVATAWHQIGIVYQKTNEPEAAEDAYRKSLAIKVRLGDVAGQASTLGQLGNFYRDVLGRTEEAAAFFRQAADKHIKIDDVANEGRDRHNLALCLITLRRLDEARQEILRAIECDAQFGHASEPWKTWKILADIEANAGNPAAAAEAKRGAIACYLAYRRNGGENHFPDGRISLAVTQSLLAGDRPAAVSFLHELAADPKAARFHTFVGALQAIIAGSRDRTLAEASDLEHRMAAEVLLLIETLEKREQLS